jgi:isoleucyl-tRNA synthetase
MDTYGADSFRFLLLSSPSLAGEDFVVSDKDVADVARKLNMVWNMYDFFTLYADVDGWEWAGSYENPLDIGSTNQVVSNSLDEWIISRVHELSQEVDLQMQKYDLPAALKPILPFIDDASNWYVRRSRRRFWKSDNDNDKLVAYSTLHYVLLQLSMILAPFTPFLSEELFRSLSGGESVHLCSWPKGGAINTLIVTEMKQLRDLITIGLSQRAEAGIKVRQPLQSAVVVCPETLFRDHDFYKSVLLEELNLKDVVFEELGDPSKPASIKISTDISPELKKEGTMREIIRNVQNLRKKAGLDVDDRIKLQLGTDHSFIEEIFTTPEYAKVIQDETLAVSLNEGEIEDAYSTVVKIDTAELGIKLQKVKLVP